MDAILLTQVTPAQIVSFSLIIFALLVLCTLICICVWLGEKPMYKRHRKKPDAMRWADPSGLV